MGGLPTKNSLQNLIGFLIGGILVFFPDVTRQPEMRGHKNIPATVSKSRVMRLKSQQKIRAKTKLNDSDESSKTDAPDEVDEDFE